MKLLITTLILSTFVFANIFNINSYSADFKQTITNNSSKEILYKGTLYLKNNGNILWSYKEPIVKNVFINNKQIILDEPELEQAIISQNQSNLNLLEILKQSEKINKNTYINEINNVKYTIKTYQNELKAIFYTDELANKIKIIFSNAKINKQINDDIFNFTTPLHYDIIRK